MDKNERYELLVQLSKFYVDKVEPNIDAFNKAILISNISITSFFVVFCGFFLCFIPPVLVQVLYNGLFKDFIAAGLMFVSTPIIFILAMIYGFIIMPKLEKMDKENKIQVFKFYKTSVLLPTSADNEIKKRLMSDFLKIFGDFNWRQYMSNNIHQDYSFVKSLKILNNVYYTFDDCIEGKYKDINIKIREINSSFFQRLTIAMVFLLLFPSLFIYAWIRNLIIVPIATISTLPPVIKVLLILICLSIIILLFIAMSSYSGSTLFFNKRFRGVFVEIDMNKNFEGQTIVLEKNNFSEKLTAKMNGYNLVKLEDINFEKQYDVYSKNQVEARYILTTAFIERLSNLKQKYKAKYVRVAFKDKKIVIAIHTGHDMFKMADMLSLTTGKETFVQLFEEIVSVLDLIDVLKLNNNLGL